jgi:hypothetical protein
MIEYIEKRNNYITTVIKKINKNIESLKKISNLNESFNELIQDGGKLTDAEKEHIIATAKQQKNGQIDVQFDEVGKTQALTRSIKQLEDATQKRISELTDGLTIQVLTLQGEVQALNEALAGVNDAGTRIVQSAEAEQKRASDRIAIMEG